MVAPPGRVDAAGAGLYHSSAAVRIGECGA